MKKILIIEDEQTLLKALESKLSKEKYEILKAIDGKEGAEMALKEHPDLILLDIIMPVVDGMKVLEKLRKDEWGKKVPVIMILTNLDEEKTIEQAKEYDVHDYLVKTNWKLEDIVEKVKAKLGD